MHRFEQIVIASSGERLGVGQRLLEARSQFFKAHVFPGVIEARCAIYAAISDRFKHASALFIFAGAHLPCRRFLDQGFVPMVAYEAQRTSAGVAPPVPRAEDIALFVDLDGTVVEFADTPEAVIVDPKLPALLADLAATLHGALALISGRPLASIDALLGLPGLAAAGQHGAELRHLDGRVERADIDAHVLDGARELIYTLAAHTPHVRIEDKGIALAFHYRDVASAEPRARELAAAALVRAGSGFELQHGDYVIELKSMRVDKGRALAGLMARAPFAGRLPWVLGDDYADEHAFAMAQALGGEGVVVGARRDSVAHHQLANPTAARTWLACVAAHREGAA
jgi:trehalose 6-phosphate phosphatase